MAYINENLGEGEKIVFLTKRHWINRIGWPVIFTVVGIAVLLLKGQFGWEASFWNYTGWGLIALGVVSFGVLTIINNSVEVGVTNKRVVIKIGIIRRETTEVILQKIESIGVDQSVLGRILNYGSLVVTGSGGSSPEYTNIAKPLDFRSQVQKVVGTLDDDGD